MASTKQSDYTEVKTELCIYNWTIKNFSLLNHRPGKNLDSPNFYVGKKKVQWNLRLFPRGDFKEATDSKDYVSLFLNPKFSPSLLNIAVKCHLSLLTSHNILRRYCFSHNFERLQCWGYEDFIKREEVLAACLDDLLIIRCEIEQSSAIETMPKSLAMPFDSESHRLGEECRRLIKEPNEFSDIVIVVGDKRLPVHRVFLSTRSSVFAGMFAHNQLKENRTREIEIDDIEPDVVEGMIEFIYTDQVENISQLADRLIAAAHKYDLKKLMIMCEEALCKILDTTNAIDVLLLADLYGPQAFEQHVIEYINGYFHEVIKSKAYQKINNPLLLKKIMACAVSEET